MEHDPGCKVRVKMPAYVRTDAVFSLCDRYRYVLSHIWAPGPRWMWFMMNPSGATKEVADQTVAKTHRMARRAGAGGQYIANACAYRATDKKRLLEVDDPVGPGNATMIEWMAERSDKIVIAHGQLPGKLQRHADATVGQLLGLGRDLYVLRLSLDGVPMHPLSRGKGHIPESTVPVLWKAAKAHAVSSVSRTELVGL